MILLLIGSIFCIGLFVSSRGETIVSPNGEKRDTWAMVLYPLTKYLCQTYTKNIFYKGCELSKLYEKIKFDFPDKEFAYMATNICEFENCLLSASDRIYMWKPLLKKVEIKYDICSSIDEQGIIKFWKGYEVAKFSQYLYKPIIGCYKCYASFWGTILFVLGTKFAIHTGYMVCDYSVLIPMWIIYCMCLVTFNCLLEKLVR